MKRDDLIKAMRSFEGARKGNAKHKEIIDIYNSAKPLPRGVKMQTSYAWCAATVSAAIIKAGLLSELPFNECSCGKMIEKLKSKNAFIESDSYLAEPGDIIFYSWKDNGVGDCVEGHDHVGLCVERDGSKMLIAEGNKNGAFGYRVVDKNARYIRGFAHFTFSDEVEGEYRIAVKGDSISKWVKNFGYDKDFIIKENDLKYPYWLTAGKKYRVK